MIKKTDMQIKSMIYLLSQCEKEMLDQRDKYIIKTQISLLRGILPDAFIHSAQSDLKSAINLTKKWMQGKASDIDLFT